MHQTQRFSDEELVAYLDGEYEYCRSGKISDAIKSDSHLAARLASLEFDTIAVQEAFDLLTTHKAIKQLGTNNAESSVKQI